MDWLFIGLTVLLGLYMAWNIGANDVANSMADAVGSRSISIRGAVIAAGICEFLGAVLVGSHVTETIRKGIVSQEAIVAAAPDMSTAANEIALGMACALLAASIWLHVATVFGMPVSTTHSIVGAIAGFGLVAAGMHAIIWEKLAMIVASWFISPVIGGVMAYAIFKLMLLLILGRERPAKSAMRYAPVIVFFVGAVMSLAIFYKGLKNVIDEDSWFHQYHMSIVLSVLIGVVSAIASWILLRRYLRGQHKLPLREQLERVERVFAPLVVITSCCVAFSHGANDVANAVGPLAAVVEIIGNDSVQLQKKIPVPFWVLMLGGTGIVLGLATYGYRVMRTVGSKITQLTPSRGIAADVAAMSTVLLCSRLSLPVSTTHTLVGAILGVGFARGLGSVNRAVTRNIFGSWLITVPAAAGLSAAFYFIGKLLLL